MDDPQSVTRFGVLFLFLVVVEVSIVSNIGFKHSPHMIIEFT